MLFWETLQNWADWGRVFADWAAFAPLVREIFRRNGLPMGEVRALPPGTNAVFRVGDLVVKIYAPAETGVGQELGRESEVQAMRAAAAVGVHTAGVVAAGELADRYAFSYLVTRFVSGAALGDVVREGSAAERRAIGRELGEVARRLHGASPAACPACAVDLFARSQDNPRWDMVPPALARELLARAKTVWARRDRRVLVHADLTGENVLRLPSGEFAVLDFGDAVLAPACVELPSLVLEGLAADADAAAGVFGGWDAADAVEALLDGLSLHDFAGNLVRDFCARRGLSPEETAADEAALARMLRRALFG